MRDDQREGRRIAAIPYNPPVSSPDLYGGMRKGIHGFISPEEQLLRYQMKWVDTYREFVTMVD
jgi:hypothetical protein